MTAEDAQLSGPDFTQGIEASRPGRRRHAARSRRTGKRCCWCAAARDLRRSARSARTTTARSPTGCWSTTPCAAPGITPASVCARAKRCARRRSNPVACWKVEQRGGKVFVREKAKKAAGRDARRQPRATPRAIVIVGGGAAGNAAAEMLRREGYDGSITMLSADDAAALRPAEPVEGLPRRQRAGGLDPAALGRLLHRRRRSTLRLDARVAAIDPQGRAVATVGRQPCALRRAAAGDRRRRRAPRRSGRRPAARALSAHARRQPRDHRGGGAAPGASS